LYNSSFIRPFSENPKNMEFAATFARQLREPTVQVSDTTTAATKNTAGNIKKQ
jgi:hypothetical protein